MIDLVLQRVKERVPNKFFRDYLTNCKIKTKTIELFIMKGASKELLPL
jgi:hypothetical protein